ncbi:hypothetical protein AAG570_012475 [Ranatra chinensis]|uniref:Uncharacterized protein n=1 Tax=Ranatra chinensis TaxID=642074 RepID=A0ABD0YE01_9HEMI
MASKRRNMLLMRSSPKLNVIRGYSANDISATVGPMSISRADTREKKPSFTKNLFLGKFDTDMLTFPESLDSEKLAAVKKNAMILKNIMNTESSAIDKSRQIIREVYGMTSSGVYTADGLKAIECVQLFESISSNPSVSLLLEQHYSVILKTIKKYGNPAMKTMYYSRLLSGECFAACALAEEIAGFDPTLCS